MVGFRLGMLVIAVASASFAQDVGLRAGAKKKDLRMGEPIIVTVEARLSVELDSIGPLAVDSVGMFEVLSVHREGDNLRWEFELMTIDTGTVFLAPIAFGYVVKGDTSASTAYANSLMFRVSGVDIAEGADIHDIKPPMVAPWRWGDVWPYLLAVVLAGGGWLVYATYFKRRSGEGTYQPTDTPGKEPHVLALEQLRELEEKKLWQQGNVKQHYSECTEIVRRFFEGRWKFPALEMTTVEILEWLRDLPDETVDADMIRTFLERADMVKFAKGQPSLEEHTAEVEAAYAIVRSMVPVRVVEEEEESVSAG